LQTTLNGLTATIAELNYVDGVTSNIQTQLGTKLPLAGGTMTGTIAGFTSTGIDDNATSTAITIDASENVHIGQTATTTSLSTYAVEITGANPAIMGLTGVTNGTGQVVGLEFNQRISNGESRYGGAIKSVAVDTYTAGAGVTYDADLALYSSLAGAHKEGMRITSAGNVEVATGNLVIGTSGKGIDFSADGNAAGMTSEVLDDYEEGTWTASLVASTTDFSGVKNTSGKYTKIGNVVIVQFGLSITSPSGGVGNMKITGLPFPVSTNYADVTTSSLQLARFDNAGTINFYGKVVNASSEINLGYNINYTGFFTNMDASEINGNSTPWMSGTLVYHIS
jgi:hypothetical protein